MRISIPKSIKHLLTVLVAAVILLFGVLRGIASGQAQAQSFVLAANAQSLAKGLIYFYSDQERFPSAVEYQDNRQIMLSYFSDFPPANLPSSECQQSFIYQRPTVNTFQLSFCLPQALNSFSSGWNAVDQNFKF